MTGRYRPRHRLGSHQATLLAAAASRGTGRGTTRAPGGVGGPGVWGARTVGRPVGHPGGARVQLDGADLPSQGGHRERLADPEPASSARDELAVGHAVGRIGQLDVS